MKKFYLQRGKSTDEGTFGDFYSDDPLEDFECRSGELPDRNNKHDRSRVNAGEYICKWQFAPTKRVWHYFLQNVSGRSGVMIHVGNYCGDVDKGYRSDVEGCILLGETVGELNGQTSILKSGDVVDAFERIMNKEDFILVILDAEDVPEAA